MCAFLREGAQITVDGDRTLIARAYRPLFIGITEPYRSQKQLFNISRAMIDAVKKRKNRSADRCLAAALERVM